MNNREVTRACMQDLEHLEATTLQRLLDEYNRERKKLRIHKDNPYFKTYPVKTKAKNTWLIFMQKSPSVDYIGRDDIAYCCVVYYYDKQGLVVMRYSEGLKKMELFWGHLFERYNERMGLRLNNTIDIIKAFFCNNGYLQYLIYPEADIQRNVGVCKDGFCFGEIQNDGGWLVNKTIVSRDLAFDDQHFLEAVVVEKLRRDAFRQLTASNYNEISHQKAKDTVLSIAGHNNDNQVFRSVHASFFSR